MLSRRQLQHRNTVDPLIVMVVVVEIDEYRVEMDDESEVAGGIGRCRLGLCALHEHQQDDAQV